MTNKVLKRQVPALSVFPLIQTETIQYEKTRDGKKAAVGNGTSVSTGRLNERNGCEGGIVKRRGKFLDAQERGLGGRKWEQIYRCETELCASLKVGKRSLDLMRKRKEGTKN